MAVVVLAGSPFPTIRKQASVGTTLQEFTIPPHCRQVTVEAADAHLVQFTGSDGDAVSSTASIASAALQARTWILSRGTTTRVTKVLVAAASGTTTVYVTCEDDA